METTLVGREKKLFMESLDRCTTDPGFLSRFLSLFLTSSPEVKQRFSDTDLDVQKRMLKASLYLMVMALEGKPEGMAHLERIARLHSREGLDVRPEFYELWLNSLLRAVEEHDPLFTKSLTGLWRRMLQPGIDFMIAHF